MAVKWTREQQKVIDTRDCNILVSAAAGSGKTAVLVARILEMITDSQKPVDIDRLLMQKKVLPDFGIPVRQVSYLDGCKVYFDEGWIIARFSGTEPRVRIFAEMPSKEQARALVRTMAEFLGLDFHD